MFSRRQFLAAAALPAALQLAPTAWAQSNVVRLVVGFAAGGAADFVARQLAQNLQTELGATVVVDNRPGAGGRIAVDVARNAKADGLTLLVTPGSILTIYPHVYDRLSYQPLRDLVPVANLCAVPYSVNIGPGVPASVTTLKEFGQWLKAHPQQASYGSPGAGTTPHFLGAMFAASAGVDYLHVPYKGGSLALQDVMGGQLTSSFNVVSEAVPHAASPKLRVLAVSSPQRIAQLPKVPTFTELGMKELTSQEWIGLLAPKGTKPEVAARLHDAANRAFAQPAVQKALAEMAFGVTTSTQAEFAQLLKGDLDKWGPVVRSTGFKAEA
ncbi:twin-arginine translocation pathway signal protein [Comamonas sp. CMM03]|uniref:Bug family tripartite tricarboxylate transporter substrate binding protein n=1 Tax=Comamonas sp. CMM03 TaxID=2854781 RepID=UPI001C46986D|nr:tripartite tricarboxylate transporter substrate-binding protein [Comamonas sp. CMM03]MBV7418285.1 twin-arginine translocation pathway signal protein [Comamonas sp. CMM03]